MFRKLSYLLLALLPFTGRAQYEFHVDGAQVYVQKGALISVHGDFVNKNNGGNTGSVSNDGIIEVAGNFSSASGSGFSVYNNNTSTDRAVKFIGSGSQTISGTMNSGTAGFYNLVIDQTNSTNAVTLETDVNVAGSLVFGTTTTTTTYNPSNLYTDNNKKGLLQTYSGSKENTLNITNGNTDAIAGYPSMVVNGAPTTGFVLTSGTRGTASGGLQRKVASATSYDYPVGTVAHGFNAVRMNFSSVPSGGGLVMGKFEDGSDNSSGSVGTITQQCIGCSGNYSTPDNPGYNRFFSENPCNSNAPQWVILQDVITNHGFWSFASSDGNQNYTYSVETFPNNYTAQGNTSTDTWRTLQYKGGYGNNPSAASVAWNTYIDSVAAINDLLEYSLNSGSCYSGSGIPGGQYSGFGQFALKGSDNDGALPVKLLTLNAAPDGEQINVTWSTALEINNNGFDVERSTDGVNYSKIGFVQGHNNSTVTQNYSFPDNTVAPNIVYYYRLNQVDNNGNSSLSNVVAAEITGGDALTISDPMPNPANVSSHIMVTSSVTMDATVKIYSLMGQLLYSAPVNIVAGNNPVNLAVETLNSGNYNAVIQAGGKYFTKSFIVTR